MKSYLTSLSLSFSFLYFLYIYVSLFFFFFGVAFHRPLISLSFFLSCFLSGYIFRSFLILWLFSWSVDEQNSHAVLMLFLLAFYYELAWEDRLLFASQARLPVWGSLGQLTCLIFPFCRFDLPADSYHVGFLANRHSAFK